MAVSIPDWFTAGNGPFGVVVVPGTRAVGGGFTAGTSKTVTGAADDVEIDGGVTTENIRPMSRKVANHVITEQDETITLVEILKASGENILAALHYGSSPYFHVTVTRGEQDFDFYATKGGYHEGLKNGKSVGRFTFKQIDTSEVNPAYA